MSLQPGTFDLHAGILGLAEATGPCGNCDGLGYHGTEGSEMHPRHPCQRCGGTGRIPLFPSLRVEQQGRWSHSDCTALGRCDLTVLSALVIRDCEGRGWVPERNVRVACWEILQAIAKRSISWTLVHDTSTDKWKVLQNRPGDYDVWSYVVDEDSDRAEEAVIRAGQAWVKEQP